MPVLMSDSEEDTDPDMPLRVVDSEPDSDSEVDPGIPSLELSDSEADSATESSGGARTNETGEVAQGDGEDVAADYYTACSSSVSPERGPRGCVHDRDSDWEGWCTSDEELTRDGFCSDCRPTRPPEGQELQQMVDFFRQHLI